MACLGFWQSVRGRQLSTVFPRMQAAAYILHLELYLVFIIKGGLYSMVVYSYISKTSNQWFISRV